MKIHEYQGKALFARYGIAVPREFLIPCPEVQPGDIRDRAAGAMVARNPLGIDQRDFSRNGRECN